MKHKQEPHSGLNRREFLRYGLYGGLAGSLSGSFWLGGCSKSGFGEKPSIILITVDTLRADHLGCYGYPKNTSPNIDQFATDGLVFENCFSHAPVTGSSFASILSGFLPHETKVFENLPLPAEVEALPEILQQQGYKTVAVISNPALVKKRGWGAGFTIYDDTMDDYKQGRFFPDRIAMNTTNRAIELLKQLHNDKLFIWIHYNDPHGPYTPPDRFAKLFQEPTLKPYTLGLNKSFSGRGGVPSYQRLGANRDFYYYVSQYDGEIRYQDENFKRLANALKEFGLYDNALIIFSADHGEDMGEHNYFFAHGENLYSSLTHVPLIIKYGREPTGRRKDFVQHLDIVPTILNIVDVKLDQRFRGRDLRKGNLTNREIFSEMKSPIAGECKSSLILDGLKLIYTTEHKKYEFYDLNTDPHEERNLIKHPDYQEQAKDLKRRLYRIQREDFLDLHIVNRPPKMTPDEIERLKSLGYIQ